MSRELVRIEDAEFHIPGQTRPVWWALDESDPDLAAFDSPLVRELDRLGPEFKVEGCGGDHPRSETPVKMYVGFRITVASRTAIVGCFNQGVKCWVQKGPTVPKFKRRRPKGVMDPKALQEDEVAQVLEWVRSLAEPSLKEAGAAPPIAGPAGTRGMSNQRFDHDGEVRTVEEGDLVPGTVIRMLNAVVPSSSGGRQVAAGFSDCLVLSGPESKLHGGARYVQLARPYAFVSGADTASPSVLTGYERFEVAIGRLTGPGSLFRTVLRSTGEPQRAVT